MIKLLLSFMLVCSSLMISMDTKKIRYINTVIKEQTKDILKNSISYENDHYCFAKSRVLTLSETYFNSLTTEFPSLTYKVIFDDEDMPLGVRYRINIKLSLFTTYYGKVTHYLSRNGGISY